MQLSLYKLFVIFAISLCLVYCQESEPNDSDCRYCDLSKCPPPGKCHVGTTRDSCGCCEVCGLEEGHLCNETPTRDGSYWHGFCGVNMECKKRDDINPKYVSSQSICVCESEEPICGSDNFTYTPCQFAAAQSKYNITKKDNQPCKTRPRIITFSDSMSVDDGSKHTLLCEIQGYPVPTVHWLFSTPESDDAVKLPGDSEEITISLRGGPEKMRLTSYLQISSFQLRHEGHYECIASGLDGVDSQKLSLVYKTKSAPFEEEN